MMTRDGSYSFGVEEEFFIADKKTARILKRTPAGFVADCKSRLAGQVGHELLQSQIEARSNVCLETAELGAELRRLRRTLTDCCDRHGVAIVAAGTFPMAEWREQTHTDQPRYRKLVDDFQIIGQRNLLCGLHVHVAPPAGVDRVDVMNRMLPWLPLFLALSASSPFWNRSRTGLMSYRQAAYDEWPRTGIPDYFHGEADYQSFVSILVQAEIIPDAGFLWWAIRPSSRYPTIEMRICDSCTDIEVAIGIASLFRCLTRLLVRQTEIGRARSSMTRMLIEENRWQAKRYGIRAEFVDVHTGRGRQSVASCLSDLESQCMEDIEHFGCGNEIRALTTIFSAGNSAERQLGIYRAARDKGAHRAESCRRVAAWLIAETRRA